MLGDAVCFLNLGWQHLEKEAIAKCWAKIRNEENSAEHISLALLRSRICSPINSQEEHTQL